MQETKVKDLLREVKKLEIKGRKMSEQFFSGDYKSAFRGSGLSFAEVRPYQYGDEVRNIDWNVTARTGEPHIKVFEEERESSVLLIVDNSASMHFGSKGLNKRKLALELLATIGYSAIAANDKAGLLLFDADNYTLIPPAKGKNQLLRILSTSVKQNEPKKGTTDVSAVLKYLLKTRTRADNCFLISDYMTTDFSKELKQVALKYDITGIWIEDSAEREFPVKGFFQMIDPETGQYFNLDNNFFKNRSKWKTDFDRRWLATKSKFQKAGAQLIKLEVGKPFSPTLKQYFKSRIQ